MSSTEGVYKRGKRWWIRYRVEGRQYRESAGPTKAQATALLNKRKVEIFEGRFFPEKRKASLTVAGLRDLWLEKAAGKKSYRDDAHRFEAIVAFFKPHTPVASLTAADVEKLKRTLAKTKTRRGTPMAPATVNRHLEVLRAAIRYAAANGHHHQDPMGKVKLVAEHNQRDRVCSPEEYERLIAAAHPKLRLAIVLGYHTGMRLGEISNLRWEDIDFEAKTVRLHSSKTKTGYGRSVPLGAAAVAALSEWPRPLSGGHLLDVDRDSLSPAFRRLCRRLGIEDLRLHDLRHTAATNLRRAGADVFTIAAITGHRDLKSLQRYQTITTDDLHKAIALTGSTPSARKATN